jgi:hypothetical protein
MALLDGNEKQMRNYKTIINNQRCKTPKTSDYHKNKELLVKLLFDMYDIDESKLNTGEGLKEIVRDIKIINILNKDKH